MDRHTYAFLELFWSKKHANMVLEETKKAQFSGLLGGGKDLGHSILRKGFGWIGLKRDKVILISGHNFLFYCFSF